VQSETRQMSIERRSPARSSALRRGTVLAGLGCLLLALPAASSARISATSVTVTAPAAGGTVRSMPAGIDCPGTCSAVIEGQVTLTAVPAANWRFDHWEDDCAAETGPACTIPANASFATTVVFRPKSVLKLYVSGAGEVTSSPAGIDPATGKPASAVCNAITLLPNEPSPPQPELCEIGYRAGQKVTLTARGIDGFAQRTWSRFRCEVGKPCTVTMEEPGTTVGATFAGTLLGLVVEGRGRVTSDPAGINCPSACVAGFATGTKVRLAASPGEDPFINWVGPCQESGATCDVTVDETRIVGAGFGSSVSMIFPPVIENADVSVDVGGLGAGSVAVSGPKSGSTTCQKGHCTKRFGVPELVKLTAAPVGGSRFSRWLGGCLPSPQTCEFDSRFITSIAACFAPVTPRDELGAVRVLKSKGKRRLTVVVRPGSEAAKLTLRLVRPGRSLTLPVVRPPSLPRRVSFALPKSLARGTYSVRPTAEDAVGCQGVLKSRQVVVPRG
jgi:hypothetical protein